VSDLLQNLRAGLKPKRRAFNIQEETKQRVEALATRSRKGGP